jgi:secreted trypsin-like serine protease
MRAPLVKALVVAVGVLAAAAPGVAQASRANRAVIGGSDAAIANFPFQVALWNPTGGNDSYSGFFCGGVIIDPLHIATAAHCVLDSDTGQVTPPSNIVVRAGTASLTDKTMPFDHAVAATSFDPSYDPSTNDFDAGVLTLASPIGGPNISSVPFVGGPPAAGTVVTVSGWGDTNPQGEPADGSASPVMPTTLQSVKVHVVDDTLCANEYSFAPGGGIPITPRLFCAGEQSGGKDSCYGDSGGPLVVGTGPGNDQLAGLVDSGAGCAQPFFPGIYTRIANPDIATFLRSNPPQAPRQLTPTSISGSGHAGQPLACLPGSWSGNPTSFEYEFFQDRGHQNASLISGPSGSASYVVQPRDVGARILCVTKASNAGGFGFGQSPTVTGLDALVQAVPTPTRDTVPPVMSLSSEKCSTSGRCLANVLVNDPPPTSGIRAVDATLSWKVTVKCRRASRARSCTRTKTKTLRGRSIGGGHYLISATKLTPSSYSLAIRAVDKAGNRQTKATRVTWRVKRRHR